MPKLIRLISTQDVPTGQAREVVAAGRIFAVFRVNDQYFVIDGICAHAGGPLGEGRLEGSVVTCPWHGWQYDVTSGKHCLSDSICQTQFPVTIKEDAVWIEVPDDVSAQKA